MDTARRISYLPAVHVVNPSNHERWPADKPAAPFMAYLDTPVEAAGDSTASFAFLQHASCASTTLVSHLWRTSLTCMASLLYAARCDLP